MISTMDMTTGQWESGYAAPEAGVVSEDAASSRAAWLACPALQAGLGEHVAARPLRGGMPPALAALDVEDFLSRMDA